MKLKNTLKLFWSLSMTIGFAALLSGCEEIPAEGSLAPDIGYKNRKQYAVSGLTQNIGEFLTSSSTLPLKFEIVNITETNGQDISALNEQLPVVRYKEALVGNESAAELALKSEIVQQPAISINPNTGTIELLEGNRIPSGEYRFDVQVSNTSGSKVLKDAIIIEFVEYQVSSWSTGMKSTPQIERVADSPNQILFVGYLDGEQLPGNRIDFTEERNLGFKGTFVDDNEQGELWNVNFPVKNANTYCSWKVITDNNGKEEVSYVSENFDFVLGIPGSYVIRLYK
ncbi:uncharacterized protein DUF5007 [Dyadobacter jejuensis]|uniref:Uncharacterized protein DUF5007 n=1 Tax=Dyadobacter jejuensis TaxID=1082580 RepID=A0A316AHB4_9BACT|nr:DUF5007 domain-containing protein [Dyadobacter jejuensis]PWJ57052.1 uncharacterized protein DUF5007 [Dyadobacter jejuensis]